MKKKLLLSFFAIVLVVPLVTSAAGFSDHWFQWLKKDQSAQVVKFSTTIESGVSYKKGDKADVVLEIQTVLAKQGLYKGDLSGLIGAKTEAAIKAWQKSHGLSITGMLDVATLNSIRGEDSNSRDGGFNGTYSIPPPTLEYLQYRCENSIPAFVRILSPWEGDQFVYNEDEVDIQVFVCDNTGEGNTHTLGIVSQGINITDNSAIEGTLELVGSYNDEDMTPYGNGTWLMNITLDSDHFSPGHYSLLTSSEGSYRINDIPQFGVNVYAGWTRPFEVTGDVVANCDDSTPPWIEVTSPNGGENYQVGETINVTWSSCNLPVSELVEVNVNGSGVAMGFLAPNGTINDGSFTVNQTWPVGNYHITVGTPATPGGFNNSALAIYDASDNDFFIGGGIGTGCDEDQVVVSIAGDTPAGVQNINQFNVLKFTIENDSNCNVLLEDLKVAYMTTDGKPYFDEIWIMDDQNNFLGENDELQTDPNFNLGDVIVVSLDQAIQINSGSAKDLILRLVNYNQPVFDNTVPYGSYSHKYLLFGFLNEDSFDFKWTTPQSPSFGGTLDPYNDGWGKRVRIPVTSLQP